jgi:hypothetical protein
VYTDDSDIFLCAIHSGWITWSGAKRARDRGRDLRIDVRVLRCAGAGAGSVFARGVGVFQGKGDQQQQPSFVREELVGRFVGGYGERCFNPLGRSGGVVAVGAGEDDEDDDEEGVGVGRDEEEKMRLGLEMEGGMLFEFDDPEDDGRGLVSAAWGTGHDGSAIEIVGVEFVEVGVFSFPSRVVGPLVGF